tara:strand:+ start:386 stop:559 length:174 start_codon:yes stop_codon:yes gene_type:complete
MTLIRNLKSKDFKNNRRTNTKMSSTAACSSVVVGLIVGWYYKDSKVLSLIILAVTGG